MKTKTIILAIILLVVLDQASKLIVYHYFMDVRYDIIPGWLGFYPVFNYQYSYVNSMLNTGVGFIPHIILFIVITLLAVFIYDYLKNKTRSRMVDYTFIPLLAGCLCAIISISFWEGVLDFIRLTPLYVVDPKDLYIDIFLVLFFLFSWKNRYKNLFTKKKLKRHAGIRFRQIRRKFTV